MLNEAPEAKKVTRRGRKDPIGFNGRRNRRRGRYCRLRPVGKGKDRRVGSFCPDAARCRAVPVEAVPRKKAT